MIDKDKTTQEAEELGKGTAKVHSSTSDCYVDGLPPKCRCAREMRIRERSEHANGSGRYVFKIIGTDKIQAQFLCPAPWFESMESHDFAIWEGDNKTWETYWESVKNQYT